MTDCPKHNQPQTIPVSKGKQACPGCVEEAQARLADHLRKST